MNTSNNTGQICSVNMTVYGISVIVQASNEQFDGYMNEFAATPDAELCEGLGKAALLRNLEQSVFMEDDFFNEDGLHQLEYPNRWRNFLDDCLVYACLHSFMSGRPLPTLTTEVIRADMDLVEHLLKSRRAENEPMYLDIGTSH